MILIPILHALLITLTLSSDDINELPIPTIQDVLDASKLNHNSTFADNFHDLGIDSSSMLHKMTILDLTVNIGMSREEAQTFHSNVKKLVPKRKKVKNSKKKVDVLLEKRQSLTYGRFYVDGAAFSTDFMKANFGGNIPAKPLEFVIYSEDETLGCDDRPFPDSAEGVVAIVRRGTCTYLEKALNAEEAGAALLVVVNSEDNLFQMPASLGEKSEEDRENLPSVPTIMLKSSAFNVLQHIQTTDPFVKALVVPQDCSDDDSAQCATFYPTDISTKEMFDATSGVIHCDGSNSNSFEAEFITSAFGGTLPHGGEIVTVEPENGCTPLTSSLESVKNKLVIVARGGCSFSDKVLNIQKFEARAILLKDDNEIGALEISGGRPQDLEKLLTPVLMVTKRSGEKLEEVLRDDEVGGAYITIEKVPRVGIFWEELRNWKRHCMDSDGRNTKVEGEKEELLESCKKTIAELVAKNENVPERKKFARHLYEEFEMANSQSGGGKGEIEKQNEL